MAIFYIHIYISKCHRVHWILCEMKKRCVWDKPNVETSFTSWRMANKEIPSGLKISSEYCLKFSHFYSRKRHYFRNQRKSLVCLTSNMFLYRVTVYREIIRETLHDKCTYIIIVHVRISDKSMSFIIISICPYYVAVIMRVADKLINDIITSYLTYELDGWGKTRVLLTHERKCYVQSRVTNERTTCFLLLHGHARLLSINIASLVSSKLNCANNASFV